MVDVTEKTSEPLASAYLIAASVVFFCQFARVTDTYFRGPETKEYGWFWFLPLELADNSSFVFLLFCLTGYLISLKYFNSEPTLIHTIEDCLSVSDIIVKVS